jgi:hypothetical protein
MDEKTLHRLDVIAISYLLVAMLMVSIGMMVAPGTEANAAKCVDDVAITNFEEIGWGVYFIMSGMVSSGFYLLWRFPQLTNLKCVEVSDVAMLMFIIIGLLPPDIHWSVIPIGGIYYSISWFLHHRKK